MTVADDAQEGLVGSASLEPVSARQVVTEMVDAGLLDEVLARIDRNDLQLTGEGGFLPEMVKAVLERGLQAELTGHLGYEKGDSAGRGHRSVSTLLCNGRIEISGSRGQSSGEVQLELFERGDPVLAGGAANEPPRGVRRLSSLRLQRLLGSGGERSEPALPRRG